MKNEINGKRKKGIQKETKRERYNERKKKGRKS